MGQLGSYLANKKMRLWEEDRRQKATLQTLFNHILMQGSASQMKAFERSFKEAGIEVTEEEMAVLIGRDILAGTLERIGGQGDVDPKMGGRATHPGTIITESGGPPRLDPTPMETERKAEPVTAIHPPSKVYRGVPKTEQIERSAAAQTKGARLGGMDQELIDREMEVLKQTNPLKYETIQRYKALPDDEKQYLFETELAPNLTQLTNKYLDEMGPGPKRDALISSYLSTHSEKAPTTSVFIEQDADDNYYQVKKQWDGSKWAEIEGVARMPVNDPTTMDEDEIMRELIKIDGLLTSPIYATEVGRKMMGISDEDIESYKIRRGDLQKQYRKIKKNRGEIVEEEGEGVVEQLKKLRMKDGKAVLE